MNSRKLLRGTAILTSASLALCTAPVPAQAAEHTGFYDDFSGTRLDSSKWLIAEKNWGGTVTENGETVDYNGGVRAENVSVSDGLLRLTGYGNRYDGPVHGINRDGTERADGKRCGAAIATREYFGSGSYEIRARIAPELGCCSAVWTFEYEEEDIGGALKITNHEIDIEFPGRSETDDFSLSHALCTTWVTEDDFRTRSVDCGAQADGQFHTYRFDWHTGSNTEKPRVEFYFDGVLTHTAEEYIPTNMGRFWLGLWFPKNWAGTPDFGQTAFEIDWVKITPFGEPGDTPQHETYPDSGWAKPVAEPPAGWLLWHSYSKYTALDSRLFLRKPDGTVSEITGDFVHAMNGSFGRTPDQITFMAIDPQADEWDIYRTDGKTVTNLTPNSGYRNEDPKWSPDGRQIVFKRGRRERASDGYVWQLALLDTDTGAVTALTDLGTERAMPCFSPDGASLYYAEYTGEIGAIMRMDLQTRRTETVFREPGVSAYYPVTSGDMLYFTKWLSAENHCDQIMQYDGKSVTEMHFDSADFNCSDACPAGNGMIFSSTKNGAYDLWYSDGTQENPLTALNSVQNDLGAAFFAAVPGDLNADGVCSIADAAALARWLLAEPDAAPENWQAGDLTGDGRLTASDLTRLKHRLLGAEQEA